MTRPHYATLLLLMLLPLTAYAQTLKVIEPGENKPLEIKGSIGDDNSFIGNIGVIAEGGGNTAIKLTMYPYVLTMANGETIRPTLIPTELMLTPNAPATFQVKVTGVKTPGDYSGKISLTLAGQSQSVFVDVKVSASVRPSLSLLTENAQLQANLVNCNPCVLARLLLSRAVFQNETRLSFEKPVGAPLVISNATVVVKGDQNKFQLNDQQLKVPPAQSQSADKYLSLPVTIARQQLPADHYTGSIYLTVADQSNTLKVPVDFNVRSAPVWPLIFLIIGIVLGRLVKFMQDKGNAIADALESINLLEFSLRNVNSEDAGIIKPMLNSARDLVHQNKVTEAVAAVNAISSRLSALNELRQIQARLTGKQDNAAVVAILGDIRTAREHIRFQQDDAAKDLIKKIKDALVALQKPGVTDADTIDLDEAVVRAGSASEAVAGLGTVTRTPDRLTTADRLRNALVLLSGLSNQFRNEATLFIVRPILCLALLILLIAMGLKVLYIDNPVFGASPFIDFFGVLIWGLSTETASRTLTGLSLTNPTRPAGR